VVAKSVRDIYRNSAEHVVLALELIGIQSVDEAGRIPAESEIEGISRALHAIQSGHKAEPECDYRSTILQLSRWLDCAIQPVFFLGHLQASPSALYALRKGLEVLHMLLHRDLRRKNLSSSESQVYYDFVRLTTKFPKPPERQRSATKSGTGT
jgi:hypothetical protein